MNQTFLKIPSYVKYISDWKEFKLPQTPTIIDKGLPGCGFTEYCLTSTDNVIICVPRIALLENKVKSSFKRGDDRLFHVCGSEISTDSDVMVEPKKVDFDVPKLYQEIQQHYFSIRPGRGCKFITTYDSFRYIREALGPSIRFFYVVVDECQSIIKDSSWKSETENELLFALKGLEKVCYVSATQVQDMILDLVPAFKDIPRIKFDWSENPNTSLIKKKIHVVFNPTEAAKRWIRYYLDGVYNNENDRVARSSDGSEIRSTELVVYCNRVGTICGLIKYFGLTMDNTTVLCSKSNEKNVEKLRAAFGVDKSVYPIGEVPDGRNNKTITFCTSAFYYGVDFISDNAKSIVISTAKNRCQKDDPAIDILQIVGRQRDQLNPWRNTVDIFVKFSKLTDAEKTKRNAEIQQKVNDTAELLNMYNNSTDSVKGALVRGLESSIRVDMYSKNYVSINRHAGSKPVLVSNDTALANDILSLHLTENIFNDEYAYSNVLRIGYAPGLDEFLALTTFPDRMRYLCDHLELLPHVDYTYSNYFRLLGVERIRANQYRQWNMDHEIERSNDSDTTNLPKLEERIRQEFVPGERYTLKCIKQRIAEIYAELGISRTAKATDINQYIDTKQTTIKGDKAYEILLHVN